MSLPQFFSHVERIPVLLVWFKHILFVYFVHRTTYKDNRGAQWLSGRVHDSRPKGHEFEPHRRHCVVVLEQDTFILA